MSRSIDFDHTSLLCWLQQFPPELGTDFLFKARQKALRLRPPALLRPLPTDCCAATCRPTSKPGELVH